ncbi:MAG: hypothetical protein U0Q18_21045 [Bryobacteraceae bacterium]
MNPLHEQRRHPRQPAEGSVTLWCVDCSPNKIEGRLTDTSEDGFRMVHTCAGLGAGRQVRFEHSGAEGIACTVWSRILADSVETGLRLISGAK